MSVSPVTVRLADAPAAVDAELARDGRYPISRFYMRPLASRAAWVGANCLPHPIAITLLGFACNLTAGAILVVSTWAHGWAALCVLLGWFCDRLDGQLARHTGKASRLGAWLDGNLDEFSDVALHVCIAAAVYRVHGSSGPWMLLAAFLGGKYLLMHGLLTQVAQPTAARQQNKHPKVAAGTLRQRLFKAVYHGPANADVRVHVLMALLAMGWLTAELWWVASYYLGRALLRPVLVCLKERRVPV